MLKNIETKLCPKCKYGNTPIKLDNCLYCGNDNFKTDGQKPQHELFEVIRDIFTEAKHSQKYNVTSIEWADERFSHLDSPFRLIKINFGGMQLKERNGDVIQSDVTRKLLKFGLITCTVGKNYLFLYKITNWKELQNYQDSVSQ